MRRTTWLVAVLAASLIAGCGTAASTRVVGAGGAPAPASAAASVSAPVASSSTPVAPAVPHFATPEAAMRYLATAYNDHDDVALAHVTTPDGRAALAAMRSDAVDLQLVSCTANAGAGDYDCQFDHQFAPGHTPEPGAAPPPDGSHAGWAQFTVAPADGPGWYMTVVEHCD